MLLSLIFYKWYDRNAYFIIGYCHYYQEKKYNLRVELWSANARNLRKNVFVDFIFFRRNISRISWKGAFVLYCNENISKFFLIIFFNKPLNISKVSWNTYISSGTVKHKVSGSFSLRTILFCNRFFYSLFCTYLYIQNFVFRIRTVWVFFLLKKSVKL